MSYALLAKTMLTFAFSYSLCQGAAMPLAAASSAKTKTEKEQQEKEAPQNLAKAKQKLTPALMMQNIAQYRRSPIKTMEELKYGHTLLRSNTQTDAIYIAASHVPDIIQLIKSYWGTHDLLDNTLRPAFSTIEKLIPLSPREQGMMYNVDSKYTGFDYIDALVKPSSYWKSNPTRKHEVSIALDNANASIQLLLVPQGISKNVCRTIYVEPDNNLSFNLFYQFEDEENNEAFTEAIMYFFENGIIVTINRHKNQIKIWDISESNYKQNILHIDNTKNPQSFTSRHELILDSSAAGDINATLNTSSPILLIDPSSRNTFHHRTNLHIPYTEINGYISCYCIQTIDYDNDKPFEDIRIDSNNPYRLLITAEQAKKLLYTQNQAAMKEITQLLTIDDLVKLKTLIQKLQKMSSDSAASPINLEEVDKQFFHELPTNIRLTLLQNYPRLAV